MAALIPFPATSAAYSRRNNYLVHSRQTQAVSWSTGEHHRATWLSSSRSLVNGPVLGSSVRSVDNWILRISRQEYLMKWADEQSLPVGATGYALARAFELFAWGFLVKNIFDRLTPLEISDFEWATGDYYPLITILLKSPLIYGCTGAVFVATMEFIIYVNKRLRGNKAYVQGIIVGAFVAGVIVSLFTGMRAPASVISVGVFFALSLALVAKLKGLPKPDHETVEESKK